MEGERRADGAGRDGRGGGREEALQERVSEEASGVPGAGALRRLEKVVHRRLAGP